MDRRPTLFILTGTSEPTGALIASYREALWLRDHADVTLILSSRSTLPREQFPGSRVLYLPLARTSRRLRDLLLYPLALIRSGWALRQALRTAGCERLQVNDFYFLEGAVARLFGYRGQIVTWVRIQPSRLGRLFGPICLWAARKVSSQLVAVSEYIRRSLPPGYAAMVLYEPAPQGHPISKPASDARFVFVGNYIPGKGQDVAVEAFHRVCGNFPAAELHFFGGDMGLDKNRAYLRDIRRLAEGGPGAPRIHFHGFVEDTATVLDGALAALNLSENESFSLTCQEASAQGVAVIATNCGGPAEIVEDGLTGYLVPIGDVDAVADRMRLLLVDPERARGMGRQGALLIQERFPADRFVRALVQIFDLPHQTVATKAPPTGE
jgi:L-malate glycosyltransferase